jgi:nuclear transport factor 2 (NTF2) superfamily protein
MKEAWVFEFAKRYTAAWCSQNAASVASFFAADGSLSINENAPAAGRSAITQVAQSFMTAFPDLRVVMDEVVSRDHCTEYHWTLTGTNNGPGGTGRQVRISGYERWQFDADGLISSSKGEFDASEYQRQLESDAHVP